MKRRLINLLIGISIFLLLTNIVIEVLEKDEDEIIPADVPVAVIDSLFLEIMNEYGIIPGWIKKIPRRKALSDSLNHSYEIKLPPDVPAPYILRDVKNILDFPAVRLYSQESKNFGNTSLEIYSNDMLKFSGKLEYDKTLSRPHAELSFIIENAYDMSKDDFEQFIKRPSPFAVAIIPSKEDELNKAKFKEFNKEYLVLLNDEIDESIYKLSTGLSKDLLKTSVGSIITSFNDAVFFVIDERSELYRSTIFNFVRDEFGRRGIKLLTRSDFSPLITTDKNEMVSLLKFYCASSESKEGRKILITAEGFDSLQNEIEKAKKKGHKFVLPSELKTLK